MTIILNFASDFQGHIASSSTTVMSAFPVRPQELCNNLVNWCLLVNCLYTVGALVRLRQMMILRKILLVSRDSMAGGWFFVLELHFFAFHIFEEDGCFLLTNSIQPSICSEFSKFVEVRMGVDYLLVLASTYTNRMLFIHN